MTRAPASFRFFPIPSASAKEAFDFHKSIADVNQHIWPRREDEIQTFADNGELFGIVEDESRCFVGLCYAHLDEPANELEVGGLTVSDKFRKLRLGTFLIRFVLAHVITTELPYSNGQRLIAHVHDENDKPRNILSLLGFKFVKKVSIPGKDAPASMKRDANDNVPGDQFEFELSAVGGLYEWLDAKFTGLLDDGKSVANFDYGDLSLDNIKLALRDISGTH